MKNIIFSLLFLVGTSVFAQERVFETSRGPVNLKTMEGILSIAFGAKVDNLNLRRSNNPVDRMMNFMSEHYIGYILSFEINDADETLCAFIVGKYEDKSMITMCESDSLDLNGVVISVPMSMFSLELRKPEHKKDLDGGWEQFVDENLEITL